jgi:hypothetical protein
MLDRSPSAVLERIAACWAILADIGKRTGVPPKKPLK